MAAAFSSRISTTTDGLCDAASSSSPLRVLGIVLGTFSAAFSFSAAPTPDAGAIGEAGIAERLPLPGHRRRRSPLRAFRRVGRDALQIRLLENDVGALQRRDLHGIRGGRVHRRERVGARIRLADRRTRYRIAEDRGLDGRCRRLGEGCSRSRDQHSTREHRGGENSKNRAGAPTRHGQSPVLSR
ncbi:hypothetical protein JM654_19785 [Microbacterium oxydans]|nr:hypothetical protein [Microbacterium oxydans]